MFKTSVLIFLANRGVKSSSDFSILESAKILIQG